MKLLNFAQLNSLRAFLILAGSLSGGTAHAMNICLMTFNSPNEGKAFKEHYTKNGNDYYELVPQHGSGDWFKEKCATTPQCDILITSAHSGGLSLFGEKIMATLDLEEMQEYSCQSKCENILGAKYKFDFYCNGDAGKILNEDDLPDHVSTLMYYGFPRRVAEESTAYHYSDYGLDIERNTAIAFHASSEVFGFSSTAPAGSVAGPLVEQALNGDPSKPLEQRFDEAFAGTSFTHMVPKEKISDEDFKLSCQAKSPDENEREKAFEVIFKKPAAEMTAYYDLILKNTNHPGLLAAWKAVAKDAAQKLLESATTIISKSDVFVDIRFRTLKLQNSLGLLSDDEYLNNTNAMIDARIKNGLDYLTLDQICGITQAEPRLAFQTKWLTPVDPATSSYFAHLASCFQVVPNDASETLKDWAMKSSDAFTRREALRALHGKWSSAEASALLETATSWSARDSNEAYASAQLIKPSDTSRMQKIVEDCMASAGEGGTPLDHDNRRWHCFKAAQRNHSFSNLHTCLNTALRFELHDGIGAADYCQKQFPTEVSLASCQRVIEHFPSASPVNLLAGCWETLRNQRTKEVNPDPNAINQSECHGFLENMKDEGHQIKQNWNCLNEIKS